MRPDENLLLNSCHWTGRGVVQVGTFGLTDFLLATNFQTAQIQGIESGTVKSTAARAKACLRGGSVFGSTDREDSVSDRAGCRIEGPEVQHRRNRDSFHRP